MDEITFHDGIGFTKIGDDDEPQDCDWDFLERLGRESQLILTFNQYWKNNQTNTSVKEFRLHLDVFLLEVTRFLEKENSFMILFPGIGVVDYKNQHLDDRVITDMCVPYHGDKEGKQCGVDYFVTFNLLHNGNYRVAVNNINLQGERNSYYSSEDIIRVFVAMLCLATKIPILNYVPFDCSLRQSFDQVTHDLGFNKP